MKTAAGSAWITELLARKPARLASVALANKMARIAWALLARGDVYRGPVRTAGRLHGRRADRRAEHDGFIPHPGIENYLAAFMNAHSLTYRIIEGADHAVSEEPWQQAYTSHLVNWATEMVLGAREEGAAPGVHTRLQPAPRREPPTAA